jgi:hypothetical protein
MEDIFSPIEFFELLNSAQIEIGSDVFILFNPFDIQSLAIIENIIAQLRDVFF